MSSVVSSWRELEGHTLDSGLRLERMHSALPFPVFTGLLSSDGVDTPVMVRFYPEDPETGSIYDRHREAQYLQHANLLRCFGAGNATLPDGSAAVYGVYEQPQAFLAELLEERSFLASRGEHVVRRRSCGPALPARKRSRVLQSGPVNSRSCRRQMGAVRFFAAST